ncbi:hypothetical protein PLESTB_001598700 [Pleodorina starrii]|uniref:F-box domain-containing protein n=1 Tax=Pleodorina starrii TaxID=330485 RepID=A0A9W6BXE9_9CHLO|nr:hypothetical protein PLESTM_001044700 [Pleodorina starrii]GLC60326.1 hypothetical protein PLESTB_001598700 [Pleodorina starrii]GLC77521.1 hypothetical protein PLESTF_001950300 [Pleodorina starrii]
MALKQLLEEHNDCARLVFSFLTRRQALLCSAVCRNARDLAFEMLAQHDSPFRKAMVVACSQPGRLIEVDVVHGAVMWNAWPPEPQPSRKRRRRRLLFTSSARSRDTYHQEPWMTGITLGPSAWEPIRAAATAEAAAGVAATAGARAGAAEAAAAVDGSGSGISGSGSTAAGSCGRAVAATGDCGVAARAVSHRPMGPTLYACCYSVPGVVAFDGTTLLPLGVLITFDSAAQSAPEGICASRDSLFVLNCVNCTVTRIGLRSPRVPGAGQGGDTGYAAPARLRNTRYGGALPYGYGVVLATIDAADGWVGWGMALAPDGRALYCAVDEQYDVPKSRSYTQAPPPSTSGNVLCVPLDCLPGASASAGAGAGGAAATAAVAGQLPGPGGIAAQQDPALPAAGGSPLRIPPPAPYFLTRGEAVLRRPSGLCFSPDGASLWVTSYDSGIVELAGPARGELAGTVLRIVPLPLPPPLPSQPPLTPQGRFPQSGPEGAGPSTSPQAAAAALPGSDGASGSGGRAAAGRRRAGGPRGGSASAAESGDPRVMLAWDLCWLPQAPPAPRGRAPNGGSAGNGGGGASSSEAAVAAATCAPPPLLCVTLHEDPSVREKAPSGAECRVGVLEVAGGEGEGDAAGPGAGAGAGSSAGGGGLSAGGRVGVRVGVRWSATREHSHPSMVCVV